MSQFLGIDGRILFQPIINVQQDRVSVIEVLETSVQYAFLDEAGCEEIQGYFFSRPLSEESVEPYIKDFSLERFLPSS